MRSIQCYSSFLWTLLAILCLSIGCSKDETASPLAEDLLTGGSSRSWKYDWAKRNGLDYALNDTAKAYRLTFNVNNTYSGELSGIGNGDKISGEWYLTYHDSKVRTRKKFSDGTFDEFKDIEIRELTADKFHAFYLEDSDSWEVQFVRAN